MITTKTKCSICGTHYADETMTEIGLGSNVFQCEKCWNDAGEPLTNGTAPAENYYLVKFASMPYEVFAYGDSPLSAIREAEAELMADAMDTTPLGGALVRRAVYKEWNNSTWRYRNDGGFIKGENWASESIDYGMDE